jgi:hypothetical protein
VTGSERSLEGIFKERNRLAAREPTLYSQNANSPSLSDIQVHRSQLSGEILLYITLWELLISQPQLLENQQLSSPCQGKFFYH